MPRVAAAKREEHAEARSEQILQAALRVFARKGFAETTMDEIAAEASLAKGSIYLYFHGKETLLEQLIGRNLLLPDLDELIDPLRDLPPVQAIPALVAGVWRGLKARKDVFHILTREIFNKPERAKLYLEKVRMPAVSALARYLEGWMNRGELRRLDPMTTAQGLFGMLWYFLQSQEFMGEKELAALSDSAIERAVTEIFLYGTATLSREIPQ